MAASVFLDTNVIVYAVDTSVAAIGKRDVARRLLRADFAISTQVVQEFYVTVTRKLKKPLSVSSAARVVGQLLRAEVVGVDASLIKLAIAYERRFLISYWDAAVIAAAECAGATSLLTEDLNHGQTYGSVKVVNPFLVVP